MRQLTDIEKVEEALIQFVEIAKDLPRTDLEGVAGVRAREIVEMVLKPRFKPKTPESALEQAKTAIESFAPINNKKGRF